MSRVYGRAVDGTAVELPPGAPIVALDVRDDLRAGREPLQRIMMAVEALQPGEVLQVRATFAPMPLLDLLSGRGFVHHMEPFADDDWSVWFWRPT